jgi:hypothetical protein
VTPSSRTAYLRGGRGDGRDVEMPLEELPELLDYVDAAGTVPYQRVGNTAEYRPATVLDKLAAPKGSRKGTE